jgi:hypothetical protein
MQLVAHNQPLVVRMDFGNEILKRNVNPNAVFPNALIAEDIERVISLLSNMNGLALIRFKKRISWSIEDQVYPCLPRATNAIHSQGRKVCQKDLNVGV